jgi:sugar diacid utilization regulator
MSRTPIQSVDVLNWPEFEAFAKRLGIDLTVPTYALAIHLVVGHEASIRVEAHGCDMQRPLKVET